MAEARQSEKGMKYYAVVGGRTGNCVVRTWDRCRELISGYPGARCAKFKTMAEATRFLVPPEGTLEQGQAPSRFYAIAHGRGGFRGVVDCWADCRRVVNGVSGACHKAFPDQSSAAAWLASLDEQGQGV